MTGLPEWMQWLIGISAVVTPTILFVLTIAANSRQRLIEELNRKIESGERKLESVAKKIEDRIDRTSKEVIESRAECREDIQAIIKQLSEYPRRTEVDDKFRDMRDDMRRNR